jgi:hypothetical protein
MLTVWHGLQPGEAAEVIGCSRATLFVRIHRARRRLRQALTRASEIANALSAPETLRRVADHSSSAAVLTVPPTNTFTPEPDEPNSARRTCPTEPCSTFRMSTRKLGDGRWTDTRQVRHHLRNQRPSTHPRRREPSRHLEIPMAGEAGHSLPRLRRPTDRTSRRLTDHATGPNNPTPSYLASLPTNATKLLASLRATASRSRASWLEAA